MTKLGLGFMRYDLNKNYQNILDYAFNNNIKYFETCYFYLNHQCENFVYDLLKKYPREEYEVCGKLSLVEAFNNEQNFKQFYYEQLKKVPKQYFDNYIIQTLRPYHIEKIFNTDIYEFFQSEKQKGNIKSFGFSEQCDPSYLKIFLNNFKWDIAQIPLNYYDWFLCQGAENYNLIKEKNIPIIAQAPYKGGLLINNLPSQVDNLLKNKYNINKEKLALEFVLNLNPNVILTGCSSLETLKTTIKIFNNYKPNDLLNICKEVIDIYITTNIIPCISCGKCAEICPRNINIPLFINAYNKTLINNKNFELYSLLKYFMPEPCNVCTHCNNCINICPFETNIPDVFKKIFELRP